MKTPTPLQLFKQWKKTELASQKARDEQEALKEMAHKSSVNCSRITVDGFIYELTINPENENQYLLDGEWKNLKVVKQEFKVKIFGPLKEPQVIILHMIVIIRISTYTTLFGNTSLIYKKIIKKFILLVIVSVRATG